MNVVKGCLKSVIPEIGLNTKQKYCKIFEKIDALDMEYEGVVKVMKNY